MTQKILVTGADGFIGSHLTEGLIRQGYDVRAYWLDVGKISDFEQANNDFKEKTK